MTSPPVTDRSFASHRAYGTKAMGVMCVLLALAGLIAWAMWGREKWFRGEHGAAWLFQPARAADASHPRPAMPNGDAATLPPPGALPDPTAAATPNLPGTPLPKPSAAIRMPLARPVPGKQVRAAAAPAQRRRHHHPNFLGLGKLWHWIRRDHHKPQE